MKGKLRASVPSAGKENDGRSFPLHGVVDRYEGDYAALVFDDGQRLLWPREQLPAEIREGVAVAITLTVDLTDTEQRTAKLKGLLADINGRDKSSTA